MTSLYRAEWPREKIPVEVDFCADWAGGYTVTISTLITISSVDPGCQGYAALETLFTEASHALVDTLDQQLASPSAPPANLRRSREPIGSFSTRLAQ
jgi:hypothetical protein